MQSVVVLKKRNLTYKSNNTVRRTGINVDKLASNMHNIENLIQPNYIRTVKTVSNNNIFQMEVNSQSGQTTKAIRTSNGIVHLCIVHSIKTDTGPWCEKPNLHTVTKDYGWGLKNGKTYW